MNTKEPSKDLQDKVVERHRSGDLIKGVSGGEQWFWILAFSQEGGYW